MSKSYDKMHINCMIVLLGTFVLTLVHGAPLAGFFALLGVLAVMIDAES